MAVTPSTMKMKPGEAAPDFNLPDTAGNPVQLADFQDKAGLVIVFACNHCPYVIHIAKEFGRLADEYQSKNIAFAAINSNDVENYPEDAPKLMPAFARQSGWNFPYLFDQSQETARAYHAACTPDFFVFNEKHKLVYRGQMDDSRPGNGKPVTGGDLRAVLDALLAGQPIPENSKPSAGCNIKWK